MGSIDNYLSDPLKSGVYFAQSTIDCSVLEELFRHLGELAKKKRLSSKELFSLANEIEEKPYFDDDELKAYLERVIFWLFRLGECPKDISLFIFGSEVSPIGSRFLAGLALEQIRTRGSRVEINSTLPIGRRRHLPSGGNVLESCSFEDIGDAVFIETEWMTGKDLLLEVISITEKGISRFRNFVKCIPFLGETYKEIKSRKAFSSRYTFRPYPLAVQLWLDGEKATTLTEDIRDFLQGAVRYHREKEWRTSIVLSAIAVEVILADLYEEQFKEYAPNKPLGDLYYKLKDKIAFPENIQKAIEIANDARISAVHRSRFPVSDREATNALFGAINFAIWNSSNF